MTQDTSAPQAEPQSEHVSPPQHTAPDLDTRDIRRLLLVTDAWHPQVNGVVRTLSTLVDRLRELGIDVQTITPDLFKTIPMPSYPEIRLAVAAGRKVRRMIRDFRPDVIHVATEGPLGLIARNYCTKRKIPFTTAFHTKFPEYVHARTRIPIAWSYRFLRWFHGSGKGIMVATQGIEDEMRQWGFHAINRWTRGVDTTLFRPRDKDMMQTARPIFLYTGRVAVEKNIDAFLSLDLPGSKWVIGGGPMLESFKKKYPDVHFAGAKHGEELGEYFQSADVFVFPSLTDTFGLVMLEAMASGLPVAAFPVPGPNDVVGPTLATDAPVGVLDHDLKKAALAALDIPKDRCRAHALANSWDVSVSQFLKNVYPFDPYQQRW
jgi:glycosyltransferase involved in cell wall biosynthesis